jgi:hypothetical protein
MGALKSHHRRQWKLAVNGEFRRWHGVDLRTVGEKIGSTTLRHLLDDEYELEPHNPVVGARNVTLMLANVYCVDIASLAMRDFALTMVPFRGCAIHAAGAAIRDTRNARGGRDAAGAPALSVAAALTRS